VRTITTRLEFDTGPIRRALRGFVKTLRDIGDVSKMDRATLERYERLILDTTGNKALAKATGAKIKGAIMKTINGPHMYSEECGCMSCHDARARECRKTSSGCFNLDDIKTECKILLDAHKDWCKRGKGEPPRIMVNVHAEMLVDLCKLADNDGLNPEAAYWRAQYQNAINEKSKAIKFSDVALTPGDVVTHVTQPKTIRGMAKDMERKNTNPFEITIDLSRPSEELKPLRTTDKMGQLVANVPHTDNCPSCGKRRRHMAGDLIKPGCLYCLVT